MDVIFLPPFHGVIQILQHTFVYLIVLARLAPVPVTKRQSHKVEAPVSYPLELLFAERFRVACREVVQQIEPAPLAILQLFPCGNLQGESAEHAHGGQSRHCFQEVSSSHNGAKLSKMFLFLGKYTKTRDKAQTFYSFYSVEGQR